MSESTGNLLARSDTRALAFKASTGALIYGIHYNYVTLQPDYGWMASAAVQYTWWDPVPESEVKEWAESVFNPNQNWRPNYGDGSISLGRGANYSSTASWEVGAIRYVMPAGAAAVIRINRYYARREHGGGHPAIFVESSDSATPMSASSVWGHSCTRVTLGGTATSRINMDVNFPVDNTKAYIYVYYLVDPVEFPDWGYNTFVSHTSTIRVAVGGSSPSPSSLASPKLDWTLLEGGRDKLLDEFGLEGPYKFLASPEAYTKVESRDAEGGTRIVKNPKFYHHYPTLFQERLNREDPSGAPTIWLYSREESPVTFEEDEMGRVYYVFQECPDIAIFVGPEGPTTNFRQGMPTESWEERMERGLSAEATKTLQAR